MDKQNLNRLNFFERQEILTNQRKNRTGEQIVLEARYNLFKKYQSELGKINPEAGTQVIKFEENILLPPIFFDLQNQAFWTDEDDKKFLKKSFSIPAARSNYLLWEKNFLSICGDNPNYIKLATDPDLNKQKKVREYVKQLFKQLKVHVKLLVDGSELKNLLLGSEESGVEFAQLVYSDILSTYNENSPILEPQALINTLKNCMLLNYLINRPDETVLNIFEEFRQAKLIQTEISQDLVFEQTVPEIVATVSEDLAVRESDEVEIIPILPVHDFQEVAGNKPKNNIMVLSDGRKIIMTGEAVNIIAISQVQEEIKQIIESGSGNFIVRTPTGSGKTAVVNWIIEHQKTNPELHPGQNKVFIVLPTRGLARGYSQAAEALDPTRKQLPYYSSDPYKTYIPDEINGDENGQATVKVWEVPTETGEISYLTYDDTIGEIPAGAVLKEFSLYKGSSSDTKAVPEDLAVTELEQNYDSEGNVYGLQYGDNTKLPPKFIRVKNPEDKVATHTRGFNSIVYDDRGNPKNTAIAMTDGMAIHNYMKRDPLLSSCTTIIMDELDKWNLAQMQFLAHCKWLNESGLREKAGLQPLRIVVTSATLDTDFIANYLGISEKDIVTLPDSERPNQALKQFLSQEEANKIIGSDLNPVLIGQKVLSQLVDEQKNPKIKEGEALVIFLPTVLEIGSVRQYIEAESVKWNLPYDLEIREYHSQLESEELRYAKDEPAKPGAVVIYLSTDSMAFGITTKPVVTGAVIFPYVIRPSFDTVNNVVEWSRSLMPENLMTQEIGRAGRTPGNEKLGDGRQIIADILCGQNVELPKAEENSLQNSNLDLLILSVISTLQKVRQKMRLSLTLEEEQDYFDLTKYPFLVNPGKERLVSIVNKLKQIGAIDEQNNLTDLGSFLKELSLPIESGVMVYHAIEKNVGYEAMVIGALIAQGRGVWRDESDGWKKSQDSYFYREVGKIARDSEQIVSSEISVKYKDFHLDQNPLLVKGAILEDEYIGLKTQIQQAKASFQDSVKIQDLQHKLDELDTQIEKIADKNRENIVERRNTLKLYGVEAGLFKDEILRLNDIVDTLEFAITKELSLSEYYNSKISEAKNRIQDLENKIFEIAEIYPASDWLVGFDIVTHYNSLETAKKKRDFINKFGLSTKALEQVNKERVGVVEALIEKRTSLKKSRNKQQDPEKLEMKLEGVENEPENTPPSTLGTVRTEWLNDTRKRLTGPILFAYGGVLLLPSGDGNFNRVEKPLLKSVSLKYSGISGREAGYCITARINNNPGSRKMSAEMVHTFEPQDFINNQNPFIRVDENTNYPLNFDPKSGAVVKRCNIEYLLSNGKTKVIGDCEVEQQDVNTQEFLADYLFKNKRELSRVTSVFEHNEKVFSELENLYNRSAGRSQKVTKDDFKVKYIQKIQELGVSKLADFEDPEVAKQFRLSVSDFIDQNTVEVINKSSPADISGVPLVYSEVESANEPVFIAKINLQMDSILALPQPLVIPSGIPVLYRSLERYSDEYFTFEKVRAEASKLKLNSDWSQFMHSVYGQKVQVQPADVLTSTLPDAVEYTKIATTGESVFAYPTYVYYNKNFFIMYCRSLEEAENLTAEARKEVIGNNHREELNNQILEQLQTPGIREKMDILQALSESEFNKMQNLLNQYVATVNIGKATAESLTSATNFEKLLDQIISRQKQIIDLENRREQILIENIKTVESGIAIFKAKYDKTYNQNQIKDPGLVLNSKFVDLAVLAVNGKIAVKAELRFPGFAQPPEVKFTRYDQDGLGYYAQSAYWEPSSEPVELETFEYDVLLGEDELEEREQQQRVDNYLNEKKRSEYNPNYGSGKFSLKNGIWSLEASKRGVLNIYQIKEGNRTPDPSAKNKAHFYEILETVIVKPNEKIINYVKLVGPFPEDDPDFKSEKITPDNLGSKSQNATGNNSATQPLSNQNPNLDALNKLKNQFGGRDNKNKRRK